MFRCGGVGVNGDSRRGNIEDGVCVLQFSSRFIVSVFALLVFGVDHSTALPLARLDADDSLTPKKDCDKDTPWWLVGAVDE